MATAIAKIPAPTPKLTSSMQPEECDAHRSSLSFEVEVVLQGYWQAALSPQMKAAVLADWADELEDWPLDQIRWALREWRRCNPNRKPNPGHVSAILKHERGKKYAARMAEERKQADAAPRKGPSAEAKRRADDILRSAFPGVMGPNGQAVLDEVIGDVTAETGITREQILGVNRTQPVANARQLTMWICHTKHGLSASEIGRLMDRDHTTVAYGINAVDERMKEQDQ